MVRVGNVFKSKKDGSMAWCARRIYLPFAVIRKSILSVFTTVCLVGLTSCCVPWLGLPQQMSINDPKISSLVTAAKKIDRAALGFKPIPETGNVRVEWARAGRNYD